MARKLVVHMLLLSLLHLLVDGICACGVMMICRQLISDIEANGIIVLYDVLAFGTQPLTGRWVDESGASPRGLKMAMTLLVGGALFSSLHISPTILIAITSTILLGMGNSIFHVYGGKYVAVVSHNDISAMGIFVSTGAVGLAIGLGFSSPLLLAVFLFAFLSLSYLHLRKTHKQDATTKSGLSLINIECRQTTVRPQSSIPILYLSCLMLVVAGRACIGESVPSLRTSIPSMSPPLTMVLVSIIVMAGKAGGGFLSKWWGVRNVFCISMLLSAAVFLMYPWHDVFVVLTLFLINLSMPCTLYLATKAVPGREGWGFGLLAMAILPGFMLGFLSKYNATCQALLMPLMATLLLESLLLLYMRERRWQVLAASVMLNILTNVPLNTFIMTYEVTSPLYLVGLECIVFFVEFFGYWLVIHDRCIAFKYSFLCNSFSAIVGFLFVNLLSFSAYSDIIVH